MANIKAHLFKSGINYDIDYALILETATVNGFTKPSDDQKDIQNQLIIDLKGVGLWSKLDSFHVFATDGDLGFAYIDWKRKEVATDSGTGTIRQNINLSVDQNGGGKRIDTGYNPDADKVSLTLNSASFGFKISGTSNVSTDDNQCGSSIDGLSQPLGANWLYGSSFGCKFYINNTTAGGFGNTFRNINNEADGFYSVTRDTNDCRLYKNAVLQSTITNSPELISSLNHSYLKGVQITKIQYGFVGGYLTTTELGLLEGLMSDYLADILL